MRKNRRLKAKFHQKQQPPRKPKNLTRRKREYLTEDEIHKLQKAAAQQGRHPIRDEALILTMFRHAFRISELVALRWDQIDLKKGLLHVTRIKQGLPATHPIRGEELRMFRKLQREYPSSLYVFVSENKSPLTPRTVHHIIARAGAAAQFPFTIHPHMLRHSTGFYLANEGHDTRAIQAYLGHANIKNTVIYTNLSSQRFNKFWKD